MQSENVTHSSPTFGVFRAISTLADIHVPRKGRFTLRPKKNDIRIFGMSCKGHAFTTALHFQLGNTLYVTDHEEINTCIFKELTLCLVDQQTQGGVERAIA